MPRAVSACRRRRRATHESPLRISLFVGARHTPPCFSRPAGEKGVPWVAPTNISLRRGAACLALFQHAVGGEGPPMGSPYEYLSSWGRGTPRPLFAWRR